MSGILSNQTAVITGGGSGIGRGIALRFVEEEARVLVLDIDEQGLRQTCQLAGPMCNWQCCDVRDADSLSRIAEDVPRLDIWVNSAAIATSWDSMRDSMKPWNDLMEVNLLGSLNGCRAAGRKMAQQGGGRIINMSSIMAEFVEIGSAHYDTAKAALNHLTRALAYEWATHGILVNAIAPGFIDTPMSRSAGANELEHHWFRRYYVGMRRIALARAGKPEEVAEAALFLASPRNSYMTGTIITVDGGLSTTLVSAHGGSEPPL